MADDQADGGSITQAIRLLSGPLAARSTEMPSGEMREAAARVQGFIMGIVAAIHYPVTIEPEAWADIVEVGRVFHEAATEVAAAYLDDSGVTRDEIERAARHSTLIEVEAFGDEAKRELFAELTEHLVKRFSSRH
ncbi:MAG TPA: hypothetical protein VGF29_07145 [Hyphomicrobiaceae bacterium]|jgi:hypothetical protein